MPALPPAATLSGNTCAIQGVKHCIHHSHLVCIFSKHTEGAPCYLLFARLIQFQAHKKSSNSPFCTKQALFCGFCILHSWTRALQKHEPYQGASTPLSSILLSKPYLALLQA